MVKIIGHYGYIKTKVNFIVCEVSDSVNVLFKKSFLGMVLSFKYIALLNVG